MNTKRIVYLLFACSVIWCIKGAAASCTASDRGIASSLFPPAMIAQVQAESDPFQWLSVACERAKLDAHSQKTYIVATYANSLQGAVQVIDADAVPPHVVAGLDGSSGLAGDRAEIQMLDIDGDGSPEIVASFSVGRGELTWTLQWKDGRIVNVSPMLPIGPPQTALVEPFFVDIDGDGSLEAINASDAPRQLQDGSPDPVTSMKIYRYSARKGFEEGGQVFAFLPCIGAAAPCTQEVALGRTDVEYRLRVVRGSQAIQSGKVLWNGTPAVTAGEIGKSGVLLRRIDVNKSNTLEVSGLSPRNAELFVLVEPTNPIKALKVTPTADCVWDEGDGLFTASFGYLNPNPSEVRIVLGAENSFSGQRADRGQMENFPPGEEHESFWVQSNGEPLAWTVQGRVAAASLASPRCKGSSPAPRESSHLPEPVRPFVDCVKRTGQDLKVRFGYDNPNSFEMVILAGPDNKTNPVTAERDQPTVFQPGIHHRAWKIKVKNTAQLVWTLRALQAFANTASSQCPDEADDAP